MQTFHNNPRLLHRLERDPGYFKSAHYNARTYFDHVWELYVQSPLYFYFDVLQEVHPNAEGEDGIELQLVEAVVPISTLYPHRTPKVIPSNGQRKLRLYVTQLLHKREVTRQTLATLGRQWQEVLKGLLGNHLGTFPTATQGHVQRKWCASRYGKR